MWARRGRGLLRRRMLGGGGEVIVVGGEVGGIVEVGVGRGVLVGRITLFE